MTTEIEPLIPQTRVKQDITFHPNPLTPSDFSSVYEPLELDYALGGTTGVLSSDRIFADIAQQFYNHRDVLEEILSLRDSGKRQQQIADLRVDIGNIKLDEFSTAGILTRGWKAVFRNILNDVSSFNNSDHQPYNHKIYQQKILLENWKDIWNYIVLPDQPAATENLGGAYQNMRRISGWLRQKEGKDFTLLPVLEKTLIRIPSGSLELIFAASAEIYANRQMKWALRTFEYKNGNTLLEFIAWVQFGEDVNYSRQYRQDPAKFLIGHCLDGYEKLDQIVSVCGGQTRWGRWKEADNTGLYNRIWLPLRVQKNYGPNLPDIFSGFN